jgi:Glycosyl transferases group 1
MRVLEISRFGLFKALIPGSTDWVRWGGSLTADEPVQPEQPSLALLARTLSRLGRREFDLIILPAVHPQHVHDQSRCKLISKAVLRRIASVPALAMLLHRFGLRSARHVVLDIHDDPLMCHTTLRLFPHCMLYFKRELALGEAPGGPSAGKFRPFPLILPDEGRAPPAHEKDIDLVFAGRLCNHTRRRAAEEARSLAARGVRVLIPDKPLPYPAFMEMLSRSWLVLSPEGLGWDCYRHYEACLAGSVPLINRPRFQRRLYLEEGAHCFYYDADRDCLAARILELLADKPRLRRMSEEGRRYVLGNHTRSAVGRYMLNEIAASEQS